MGVMNRLSGLFTSLAFLLVGTLYGFESGDNPGLQPGQAARFLIAVFPFIVMVLSAICARFLHFPPNENAPVAEEAQGEAGEPGKTA